jgi:hypothetical protein
VREKDQSVFVFISGRKKFLEDYAKLIHSAVEEFEVRVTLKRFISSLKILILARQHRSVN